MTEIDPSVLVTKIMAEMASRPKDVSVESNVLGRNVTYKMFVHRDDIRKAIGKEGANAKAMQRLLKLIGERTGERYHLTVVEPPPQKPNEVSSGGYREFDATENWSGSDALAIAKEITHAVFKYSAEVEIFHGEGFSSSIEITVDERENHDTEKELDAVLKPIFNAIGKAGGRNLLINVGRARV